jgi:hypothetical protein
MTQFIRQWKVRHYQILYKICNLSLSLNYYPRALFLSSLLILLSPPLLISTPLPLFSYPSPLLSSALSSQVLTTVPSWVLAERAWSSSGLLIEAQNNKKRAQGTCQSHNTYSVRNVQLDGDQMNLIIRELQVIFITSFLLISVFYHHFSWNLFPSLSYLFVWYFIDRNRNWKMLQIYRIE